MPRDFASRPRHRSFRPHVVRCVIGLAISTAAGIWILNANPAPSRPLLAPPHAEQRHADQARAIRPFARLPVRRGPSMLDPAFLAGAARVTFGETMLVASAFQPVRQSPPNGAIVPPTVAETAPDPSETPPVVVADTQQTLPLPTPRPALLSTETAAPVSGRRRLARQLAGPVAPAHPIDRRSPFDTLFGLSRPPVAALAYAAPEDANPGLFGAARGDADRGTAVYDIAAHTVTLPDGTRLEAHSGLGPRLDDPSSVAEHMRGATPPNVYVLEPREQLFHGVRALRLNPIGGTTYGRIGLLAHSFMLGPRGDSNGCVVFRDYKAFRAAYDNGKVKRLMVVAGRS